ncbi:transposase [Mesorhizobium sp. WSM3882]|uniref:IS66 family transposase n=1 Tax=Mesorhizobium sp. WSM3882 TaxID=2029407 RepID=UPI001FD963B2|nr:transposase [Mesorhizobium sp. WSM3882]
MRSAVAAPRSTPTTRGFRSWRPAPARRTRARSGLRRRPIRGLPPAERLAARRRRTRPLVRALRPQLMRQANGLSRHADIAKAFAYGNQRWRAFNRFLYDGQLEPDNLIAERAIRGFTVGRRNWLFSGNFATAERSAVVLSIIETCKLCGVDAEAYMGRCHRAHPERLASLALG